MDAKEKRKKERRKLIENRQNDVIKAAKRLFIAKGIENTSITEIATEAEIGVASIYRYFTNKSNIVIEVGIDYWETIIHKYNQAIFYEDSFKNMTGLEKVEKALHIFLTLYEEESDFLCFIEDFDNFIVKNKVEKERLTQYEESIVNFSPLFEKMLDEGKKDGSIRKNIDNLVFYSAITHSLITLSQKLLLRGNILNFNHEVAGALQIEILIDMAIDYLKNH